jgi:hypothetical protein
VAVASTQRKQHGRTKEKGREVNPHPFLIYSFIISGLPTHPANFSDFILSADAVSYGENRENGGLTRFAEIEMERVSCEHPG